MEFKGTKGWKLGSARNNTQYRERTDSDMDVKSIDVDGHEGHIMLFGDNDEKHNANAKLIAAAPELLKALQEIVHDFESDYVMSSGEIVDNPPTMLVIGYNIAKEAINKALN